MGRLQRAGLLAALLFAALLCAGLLLAGCAVKNDPIPLGRLLPAAADLRARLRAEEVIVSWVGPTPLQLEKFDGIREFRLQVDRLTLYCTTCPPRHTNVIYLEPDSEELIKQGGRYFYLIPRKSDPTPPLKLQVTSVLGAGTAVPSPVLLLQQSVQVPKLKLQYEWEPPGAPLGPLRFYWQPQQQRVLQVFRRGGGREERVVNYRTNIYRHLPGEDRSLTPLIGSLIGHQWRVSPSELRPDWLVEFELRHVDEFGNEGPPAIRRFYLEQTIGIP